MTHPLRPIPEGSSSAAKTNRDHFNQFYEDEHHEAGHRRSLSIRQCLDHIPVKNFVAEIGCNSGVYTLLYKQSPGIVRYDGFDIAPEALKQAAARCQIATYVWDGNANPCPAPNDTYDVIICCEVIEHIVDTDFFISELMRILKPNGKIILTTPNLLHWLSRLKLLFGIMPYDFPGVSSHFKAAKGINPLHIRMGSMSEWAAFFESKGLRILSQKGLPWVTPSSLKGAIIWLLDRLAPPRAQNHCFFLLEKQNGR